MQQETTDDLVARFRAALEQKDIAAREWERQAEQFKASADRLRGELDQALAAAAPARFALERLLGESHAAMDVGEEVDNVHD